LSPIAARVARLVGLPVLLVGLAALFPQAAGASSPPTLKKGSTGYWVRVLQQDLTDVGYPLPITGTYGDTTMNHVNTFKQAHALRQDGVASTKMWSALQAAVRAEESRRFERAHINSKGLAVAPKNAPIVIKRIIAAANHIAFRPYVYGGGHASFQSRGYDCSGSVSYALHGGGLLWYPEDSSELESYGDKGAGKWITIYANAGHAWMMIAGLRFDTAAQSSTGGNRWTTAGRSSSGYVVRHPAGY
jgi:cell wall-associated NlpC family hydrolase